MGHAGFFPVMGESFDAGEVLGQCGPGLRRALVTAFGELERFPALVAARDHVLALLAERDGEGEAACAAPASRLAEAIGSDVALTVAVVARANAAAGKRSRPITSVAGAVEALEPSTVREIVTELPTFDFFERSASWDVTPEHFRLHALTCQRVAGCLARAAGDWIDRDELLTAALLHDIGKLALLHAFPRLALEVHGPARTPEERLARERQALHADHAEIGAALARHWGLPARLQTIIAGHHAFDAGAQATFVRLADMLAHRAQGGWISPTMLLRVGGELRIGLEDMRTVLYDLPALQTGQRLSSVAQPLSEREIEVLRGLDAGKVYKQIAGEMLVSTSTVRTHLHNIYRKLGAHDRAQAVLIARDRGWL